MIKENIMVTGIILINTERSKTNDVAKALIDTNGITEVFSVGGRFDLVALCRVNTNDQLADLVNVAMANNQNIVKTETLIAFQAFSKHDLEAMFSIGN
jgi:DNA-binding Lrp family transcriptional regulator